MGRFASTAALIAAVLMASPALAQSNDPGGFGGGGPHGSPGGGGFGGSPGGGFRGSPSGGPNAVVGQGFRGRDFGSFTPAERSHWSGGEWRHTWYNGIFGWWWVLDDEWYFYDQPIYPYPAYVGPSPPTIGYWYHCADPAGFYPYVSTCPGGWQPVPAVPPELVAPPTPPPPPPPGK